MQIIWKYNFPLGVRQILGLERKTDSFPDNTIVSFHLPITDGMVGCGLACCYSSLGQVVLEFL